MKTFITLASVALCSILSIGCSTIQLSPTGRVASDQMLNTLTIERAVNSMCINNEIKGNAVKIEVITPGTDQDYLNSVLSAWVTCKGGRIASDEETDLMHLKVLVQSSGSDHELSQWSIPIVFPSLTSGMALTKIELYKSTIQVSRCRLWAYATDPIGNVLFTQTPVYWSHYIQNRELFGVSLGKSTDVPELKKVQTGFHVVDELSENLHTALE